MRTPDAILAAVARRYGVGVRDITGPSKAIAITRARQHAMLTLREELGLSLVAIGLLVNRHNTTVDVGLKTAARRRGTPVCLPECLPRVGRPPQQEHEGPGRGQPRDPVTNYPIGEVPKGHALYESDQEMVRFNLAAGLRPVTIDGKIEWRQSARPIPTEVSGWRQSSLGDLG